MDIEQRTNERRASAADLKRASAESIKQIKKGVKSWRASAQYRARALKEKATERIEDMKTEAGKGEDNDGDEDASREGAYARDLLGDADRPDNEAEADDGS